MAKQMTRAAETGKENNCDLAPGQYRRDMTVSAIRAEEGEGRKVTLSFSSEEPYDRALFIEILDLGEGAVDLTRLNEIG